MNQDNVTFVLCQPRTQTTLKTDRKYPPLVTVSGKTATMDADGYPREIRYIPSEREIFLDLQRTYDPRKEAKVVNKPTFTNGVLIVKSKNLLDFLRAHPANEANSEWGGSPMFRELDRVKMSKQYNDDTRLRVQAVRLVFESDFKDKILPIAEYKGFDINTEEAIIIHNVQNYANENPQEFLELLDSQVVQRYGEVGAAERAKVIKILPTEVTWFDGRRICDIPANTEAKEYFSRISFDEKMRGTWREIVRLMTPKNITVEEAEETLENTSIATELKEKSNEEIFNIAVQMDVVRANGMWFSYGSHKHKGKKAFIDAMNVELRNLIIAAIAE